MGMAAVNRAYLDSRLAAVRDSLARLHAMRNDVGAVVLPDADRFAIAEHRLRRLLECALDVARHILARDGTIKPATYPELMEGLARIGAIPAGLARRARDLAEHRNRLVHLGPEVTPDELSSLITGPIQCLRDYCKEIEDYLASKAPEPPSAPSPPAE